MDSTNVIEKEYVLIDRIKNTKEYKELKDAFSALYTDSKTSSLINEFNKAKEADKLLSTKETIKNLSDKKRDLYQSELYKNYYEKLTVYNSFVSEMEERINDALFSIEIKELFKMR